MGSVLAANAKREGSEPDDTVCTFYHTIPSVVDLAGGTDSTVQNPCRIDDQCDGTRTPDSKSGLTPGSTPIPGRSPSQERKLRPSPSPTGHRKQSPSSGELSCDLPRRKLSAQEMMKAKVLVKTGDQDKSGTDANVYIQLEDESGLRTAQLKLDTPFYDDLERGKLDTYCIHFPEGFGRVTKLYMKRDRKGMLDGWFCDYIIVQDSRMAAIKKHRKIKNLLAPGTVTTADDHTGPKAEYYFPVHRWVNHTHTYEFPEYGCSLPQFDPCPAARLQDLEEKRNVYKYSIKITGGPVQVEKLPSDEKFSDEYFWTFVSEKATLLGLTKFIDWTTTKWASFHNFKSVFKKFKTNLGEPKCVDVWREDRWFGMQRVMGVNCLVVRLCTAIPDKLDVTNETVCEFLEGLTLTEALESKRIFICDLEVLDGLPCKDDRVLAAPITLFFLNQKKDLMPIAIQLMQRKAPNNPVFTPADSPNTWLVAKMYYNNAEAQHHQGYTHLGRTHILAEGMCVCTHRNLSPSHPLFKLLAPHFLFLLAINFRGLEKLVSVGGWVDRCMTQGVKGIFQLISKSVRTWRADVDGVPEEEMRERGVLDPAVLPNYPYRDDAIPLYVAIKKYVTKVLQHHYDTPDKITNDQELQQWRREMVAPTKEGGVEVAGVPGGLQGFTCVSEVIDFTTAIIGTCTLGHAGANFQQYEQYAFVPNYPGILMEPPPTDKREFTEKDILHMLPNKSMTLDIILISKLLSKRGTNTLGDFEMQYMYDPADVEAAKELCNDLARLSLQNKMRNLDREREYAFLDPQYVPNSISV